jgi:hypothetical protein
MKKKQKVIVGVLIVLIAIIASLAIVLRHQNSQSSDTNPLPRCNQKDREQNNCVPAGRCTPPGDPLEAFVDCDLKNYDHKFNLDK